MTVTLHCPVLLTSRAAETSVPAPTAKAGGEAEGKFRGEKWRGCHQEVKWIAEGRERRGEEGVEREENRAVEMEEREAAGGRTVEWIRVPLPKWEEGRGGRKERETDAEEREWPAAATSRITSANTERWEEREVRDLRERRWDLG